MTSYREMQAELERLHQESERTRRIEKGKALEKIRALIAEYDLQPGELGIVPPRPEGATASPPRYRDPLTGATWTGRGRVPRWLVDKDREQFLIK